MYENLVLLPPPPVVVPWWQRPDLILSGLGVFVAVLTLVCVLRQLKLERRQTDLAAQTKALAQQQISLAEEQTKLAGEQTRLAQRQNEIVEQQQEIMSRRSKLRMIVKATQNNLELRAVNDGTKSARDFYWYLFVLHQIGGDVTVSTSAAPEPNQGVEVEGRSYIRYARFTDLPLYPGRDRHIAHVRLPAGALPQSAFLWRIIAEDGVFPGEEEYGKIELT